MARKEIRITIDAEGRDRGKTFVLREMPSDQAEWWFIRFVLALANAGAKVPEGVLFAGAAEAAEMITNLKNSLVVAIRALQGLDSRDIKALLDEMMPFISYQPPGGAPEQTLFPGLNMQAEEVATLFKLRFELIQLHLGFSLAAAALTTESGNTSPPQAATA